MEQICVYFIITGDTNELNLYPIVSLSKKIVQVVQKPIRIDSNIGKESRLDTIITTLSSYYQEPNCIDTLDVDNEKNKEKSDHKIVFMEPIDDNSTKSARVQSVIKLRPVTKNGLEKYLNG